MFRFFYIIFINLFRVPYIIPRLMYMAGHVENYTDEERYKRAKGFVRMIKVSGFIRTKTYGKENLPQSGGYILFPNHQGKYDALGIVHAHDKPCGVVMDEAKSHAPVTSQIITITGGKRMKVNDVRQALTVIREMAEEAKNGKIFVIFPEGGYRRNHNTLQEFKPGSFKCATMAKVPIVPVALIDSWKVFEGFGNLLPVRTEVHFLKPIMPEEYEGLKTTEIAELVKGRIQEKIDEVLSEREKKNKKAA